MSGLSVADYFPWRRVKVVCQNVNAEPPSALIRIEPDQRYRPVCHACGGPARTVHAHGRKFVRDLPFGGHEMMLQVEYRKIWCDACGGVRVEQLEFVDASRRVTNRLAAYAVRLCRAGLSVKAVARHLELDPKTVKTLEKAALEVEFGRTRYEGLRRPAIDEIAVRKGHSYMTVVLDYDTGRVVWMGDGRQIDTRDRFHRPGRDRMESPAPSGPRKPASRRPSAGHRCFSVQPDADATEPVPPGHEADLTKRVPPKVANSARAANSPPGLSRNPAAPSAPGAVVSAVCMR